MTPSCPYCNSNRSVHLTSPDYGYGYGAEFACYGCDVYGRRFSSNRLTGENQRVALEASASSRATSAANAAAYRKDPTDAAE